MRQSQPVAGAEGERILVVDDDAALRASTARILKQRGYAVLEACDGNDAMRQLRASAIDLMITDVVMPGMSGRELGERAHREFPRLRMLYTSGYTDDEVVRRGVMQSQVAFLEKPFGLGALASKVRQVLDAR